MYTDSIHVSYNQQLHPLMEKLASSAQLNELSFPPSVFPSLTPPLPWTNSNSGGHLLSASKLKLFQKLKTVDIYMCARSAQIPAKTLHE